MSGLNSGMNACVSGLKGVSQRVNCHTQNLAAAGAYGSKQRAAFLSVINTGKSMDTFTPGGIAAANQHFITTVGSPVQSDVSTHMALEGQGFFVVNSSPSDTSPGITSYTRVGTFTEDKDGNFVNHVGDFLKVFYVDPSGNPLSSNTTDIAFLQTANTKSLSGNPIASATCAMSGLLSAQAATPTTKVTNMSVYDSLGVLHTLNLTFTQISTTPTLQWGLSVTTADGTVTAPYDTAPGMTIDFDSAGLPTLFNGAASPPPNLDITWTSTAAAPSSIAMNLGTIGQKDGLRCVGSATELTQPTVDGRGAGKYLQTSIDSDGFMTATFDNGTSQKYARIPLATFANANQLVEQTGGSFTATDASGSYILNFPKLGQAGAINAASLEESTIDAASVFTDLIVDQQRYTANLRGISTIEEMLQALERSLG
ncbi:flagellar hook-basal body complex protein [Candidatus Odyssella thessalonicensis]|uniref:flagellar hook-basal body complex protein n=1 Tax=Candidatus Odyssella thessalonicensis TaxID=84647 RepID=UPI000225AECE|nr:flagellar hook-basal body complex protein [Candidatus Odyssella thessalonicensis]